MRNCLKYLNRGWDRKKRRGHKDFKRGGKLGQGVGALKRLELEPPNELCYFLRKIQTLRANNTRIHKTLNAIFFLIFI